MSEENKPETEKKSSKVVLLFAFVLLFFGIAVAAYVFNARQLQAPMETTEAEQSEEALDTALGEDYPPMPDTDTPYETAEVEEDTGTDEAAIETAEIEPAEMVDASSSKIAAILSERSVGEANAPIVIEEFSSLTCPHCAAFHEQTYDALKEKYIDTGKARIIFRDFPLDRIALDAVIVARCLPAEQYESFINLLFKNQRQWAAEGYEKALRQNAKLAGLSDEEFDFCLENKEIQEGIAKNMRIYAEKYDIQSTPSFVLNEGKETVRGVVSINSFSQVIEKLLRAAEEN